MEIYEITENKRQFMELLFLADEQEEMIEAYLDRGAMFVLDDGGVKAECVVLESEDGVLEIKNLAVLPDCQKRGYGRKLIDYLADRFAGQYAALLVGTGDSPLTVPFYEHCGFSRCGVIEGFFPRHYDHPIVEAGVLLKDMILLKRPLRQSRTDR